MFVSARSRRASATFPLSLVGGFYLRVGFIWLLICAEGLFILVQLKFFFVVQGLVDAGIPQG